ncbi:MAG: lysophospholipase [Chloroflexi bacterium]|nr:lysophospholipase [Chloroflexota bacterium]
MDTGGVSAVLMAASKILSRIKPDLSVATGLDASGISRDPEVVKAYQNDPLVHGVGTPRLAVESPAAMAWCQENAAKLQIPILMLHGTADRLTSPRRQPRLLRQADRARQNLPQLRRRLPRKPQRHPPRPSRRRHSKLARRPSLKISRRDAKTQSTLSLPKGFSASSTPSAVKRKGQSWTKY